MSLSEIISETHKEIVGSRTKNRLTVQISYAIQLIMDFYSIDFLVMMDYIEDVAVICDPKYPSAIHLYQIKTKSSDKQYLLTTVISDEWFQKLYKNAKKYNEYLKSASVVCNTDVVTSISKSNAGVFPNEKTSLDDDTIQKNIKKIRQAISKDLGIEEKDVDLSKFYFVRSTLSTKNHKEEIEHKFENFLVEKDPDVQVATVKSIFRLLYDELDDKFNHEINDDCTDVNEIFRQKGISSDHIKELISCGLAVQLPTLEKLFSEFCISSVSEKRKYSSRYSHVKMDMYSNMTIFIELKKKLLNLIEEATDRGIDDMPGILDFVYHQSLEQMIVPAAYSSEHYLKILVMILVYRYCYGGEQL